MGYVELTSRRSQARFIYVLSQLIECGDSLGLTEINAMQVLDQRQFERVSVGHVAFHCPDAFFFIDSASSLSACWSNAVRGFLPLGKTCSTGIRR